MSTWQATANALVNINRIADQQGFCLDCFGVCLDRRMGLPQDFRDKVPAETGPTWDSTGQWQAIGGTVPIQPHMGDFMIGFPGIHRKHHKCPTSRRNHHR
ncbi:MAG: hypothetical protein GY869_19040 [Planctomycetes bacterium]|nr:hypothetical protein [Planctomycetota bacterium]